jgi:TolA-binding protein
MSGYDHQSSDEVAGKPGRKVHEEAPTAKLEPASMQSGYHQSAPTTAPPASAELPAFVADLEASLGDSFPVAPPVTAQTAQDSSGVVEQHPAWPAQKRTIAERPTDLSPESMNSGHAASAVQREIEISAAMTAAPASSLAKSATAAASAASGSLAPAMSDGPVATRPRGSGTQTTKSAGTVDLSEMFGELKLQLEEEVTAGDDDPETHYNLGVAFREMGLLDEAIAEFQKVCSALDQGKQFSQQVQSYTWLAQCFLDKGVPEAAVRWYERALNTPGVDQDGRLAITYELGSACENAQDKAAALRHFTEVYGANIDYRDVAERIQALKS